MANFKPLNNYTLFVLNKLIGKYSLRDHFLDVACGTGYLSKHLAKKGWSGLAIDYSSKATRITKANLKEYKRIKVERKSLLKVSGKFHTVLMFDILEHIKDDLAALKKVNSLLSKDGYLVIATPSNPTEWRWDDDFYGHFRRYTPNEIKEKLIKTGFKPIVCYDYTFPFFWLLRRILTKLWRKRVIHQNKRILTQESSFSYSWNIPIISALFNQISFLFYPIYLIQYLFFKSLISKGNAIIILAKKIH